MTSSVKKELLWLIATIAYEMHLVTNSQGLLKKDIDQNMRQLVNSTDDQAQLLRDLADRVLDSVYITNELSSDDDEFELPEDCDVVFAPRTFYDCTLREEFGHIGSYGVFYI